MKERAKFFGEQVRCYAIRTAQTQSEIELPAPYIIGMSFNNHLRDVRAHMRIGEQNLHVSRYKLPKKFRSCLLQLIFAEVKQYAFLDANYAGVRVNFHIKIGELYKEAADKQFLDLLPIVKLRQLIPFLLHQVLKA